MNYHRQLDILDPDMVSSYDITLIGCGGIGSPTALALSKIGCQKLTVIDPDIIEEHNLPNQLFHISDVEKHKVEACKNIIRQFSDCAVNAIPSVFDGSYELPGIVISGVDSMASRRKIWEKIKFNLNVPLYIDGRIGAEIIQIYTIQPCQIDDIEKYEKFLFSDAEAAKLPCTAKAIMYTGFVVAGLIGSQLKKWIKKEQYFYRISLDLKTMSVVLQ